MESGRSVDYVDLYTRSRPKNRYGADFNGILRFKDEQAATESVRRLNDRCIHYRKKGDRQGIYQARSLALIGYERAMGLGKIREAAILGEWLAASLAQEVAEKRGFEASPTRRPEA